MAEPEKKKKILYVDMDNVLVDFQSAFPKVGEETVIRLGDKIDEYDGLFSMMEPMPGAIEAFNFLSKHFDTCILSTAPWKNPSAWKDKLLWVQKYLPMKWIIGSVLFFCLIRH